MSVPTDAQKNHNALTGPKRWLTHFIFGARVMQGPFEGMKYLTDSVGSAYWPKWFGSYESELVPLIEALCRQPFSTIVDVGAAEGYYAVGLARRQPTARVVAFEAEAAGRSLIERMAKMNSVESRLEVHGYCDSPALSKSLHGPGRKLIIMDVEGAEDILLDPVLVPELASTEILVELHGDAVADGGAMLAKRFATTHQTDLIRSRERDAADLPPRLWWFRWILPAHMLARAIKERPAPQSWLHFHPLGKEIGGGQHADPARIS